MNNPNDLREARGELRQFMRGLQEDPGKNVIPYGNDATLADNVWITHAEVVYEFVRINPHRKPLAETLVSDSSRKYRLDRKRWLEVKEKKVASVVAATQTGTEPVQLALDTEPMATAFCKMLKGWCGEDVQVETGRDAGGHYLVRLRPKSAAERDRLSWLYEGFKKGYFWGQREGQGAD